jgi:ribosome recycling factor
MTQDFRDQLVKQVHAHAEKAKVGIRKIRQHARDAAKRGNFSDDATHVIEKEVCSVIYEADTLQIQRITDELIKNVDSVTTSKEKELKT